MSAANLKIKAILPYFGCKRKIASRLVECFGPHSVYWEPMAGSLAVLFAKPKCRVENVNDLNGSVVNLARVIAHKERGPDLFGRLSRTVFCEALYQDSVAWLNGEGPAFARPTDWAYHYFVASWMGRNGLVGTTNELRSSFCIRYTANGGDPAVRFRNAVSSIPGWYERLESVGILKRDGVELCERIEDKEGTIIYVDPPYLEKTAQYVVDFRSEDHGRLASVLKRFKKTRVFLSYYAHPQLAELYPGWAQLDLETGKNMGVASDPKKRAPEVLLMNREMSSREAA